MPERSRVSGEPSCTFRPTRALLSGSPTRVPPVAVMANRVGAALAARTTMRRSRTAVLGLGGFSGSTT